MSAVRGRVTRGALCPDNCPPGDAFRGASSYAWHPDWDGNGRTGRLPRPGKGSHGPTNDVVSRSRAETINRVRATEPRQPGVQPAGRVAPDAGSLRQSPQRTGALGYRDLCRAIPRALARNVFRAEG